MNKDLFPDASRELIGKKIVILDPNDVKDLTPGQVVTVNNYRSGQLGIKEINRFWSCSHNSRRGLFYVQDHNPYHKELTEDLDNLSPTVKQIFFHLNKLIFKLKSDEHV
jgi:hypothetical protein